MGKKSGPKLPPPPDPTVLAETQGDLNRQTLIDLISANRINQVTPFGSISFTGGTGPGGVFGQTQEVELAPGIEQTLLNQQELASTLSGRGADLARNLALGDIDTSGLTGRVTGLDLGGLPALPGADDFGAERGRVESAFFDRQRALLDPAFAERRRRSDTALADRGFDLERSEAAQTERDRIDRAENEALLAASRDAVLAGGAEQSRLFDQARTARGTGLAELLANAELANRGRSDEFAEESFLRNLPLSDLGALSSLTPNLPVLQPGGFATPSVAPPDFIGASLGAHNAALQNAQIQQQNRGSLFGGLVDLAGAIGSAAILSDRRLKAGLRKIGEFKGLKTYSWRWNALAKKLFGLTGGDSGFIAQDVRKKYPHAVVERNGFLRIDYSKLAEV